MNRKSLFFVVFAVIALGGCEKPPAITTVYMDKTFAVGVGETVRLTVMVSPPDADLADLVWLVEHPEIVSLNRSTGELTGLTEGVTRVHATARGKTPAVCEVTVEQDVLVNVPDLALRAALEEQDPSGNGNITPQEVGQITEVVLESPEISSLEGLEVFPNLTNVTLRNTRASLLDELDHLPNMKILLLDEMEVSSLDFSRLSRLTNLYIADMPSTEFDLSPLTSLTRLTITRCELTSLDVSMLPTLRVLSVLNNLLRSMDISNNTRLIRFICDNNPGLDGVFTVRAWFDNESIPTGPVDPDDTGDSPDRYIFPEFVEYNGELLPIDYQKVD